MKTTLEIQDGLLAQAKRHAKRVGRPLRALVEDGLRTVLANGNQSQRFTLVDCSVGDPHDESPLASLLPDELRELMHGGR